MKIRNNIFGDYAGKLGGVVFSSNKSGAIVRKRTKGHNPKTAAQTTARTHFGSGSGGWDSLTAEQQRSYNSSAKIFRPLRKKNTGSNYTGAQCFRSISNIVQASTAKFIATLFKHGTGPEVTLLHTDTMPAIDTGGVDANVSNTIQNGVGSYKYMSISGVTLTAAGALRFELNFDPSSPAFAGAQFIDGNGLNFGMTAYVSSPVKKESSSCNNKLYYNVGFSGIPNFTPVPLTGFNQIHCSWDISSFKAAFKAFPGQGKSVYVSIYAVATNGTIVRIGEAFVTIS